MLKMVHDPAFEHKWHCRLFKDEDEGVIWHKCGPPMKLGDDGHETDDGFKEKFTSSPGVPMDPPNGHSKQASSVLQASSEGGSGHPLGGCRLPCASPSTKASCLHNEHWCVAIAVAKAMDLLGLDAGALSEKIRADIATGDNNWQ